ncbi:MAG: transposon-transfer assisting family protein [Subdoligranulum sp.]
MGSFTFEEMNLLCIYNTNTGSRTELIEALTEMRGELSPEEAELRELTDSALAKLRATSDAEFSELDLRPDFGS